MNEFDAIYGYGPVKQELLQIADCLRNAERYRRLGARMPSGLLIDGQPGLGKTLMATCLVKASGLEPFVCRKSKKGSGMLKAIRSTFESAAAAAPAIVFLDDIDKLSNSPYNLRDTQEYVTVQSCIDKYKDRGVFVLATSNDMDRLPESLVREGRFDRVIRLQPPRGEDCLAITRHYLSQRKTKLDIDPVVVADIVEGNSCAFLETVVNEASLMAGFEQARCISHEHIIRAYVRLLEKGSLAEPLAKAEPARLAGDAARAEVAYHEAGHVLIGELLRPGSVALAFIAQSQGLYSGVTKEHSDKPAQSSGAYLDRRDDILITLAGALAVEWRFGVPCVGSRSDNMRVVDSTMSLMRDAMLFGANHAVGEEYSTSDTLLGQNELACATFLQQCRWEVQRMLAQNATVLDALADRLYARGYLLAADVAEVMGTPAEHIRETTAAA